MPTERQTEPPSEDQESYVCGCCSEEHEGEPENEINNDVVCEPCFEEHGNCCFTCDEINYRDNQYIAENGQYYCEQCYHERYSYCESCDEYCINDEMSWNRNDELVCDDCRLRESSNVIRNYSYRPNPIFHTAIGKEKSHQGTDEKRLFFGFELEVERSENTPIPRHEVAKKITEYLESVGLGLLLYYKEDSSIRDGFEIVSHPMSYEFFKANKATFTNVLSILSSYKMRSYDTNRCGLHVHLSRNAFTHSHILKFQNFWNNRNNAEMLKTLSQRDNFGYCELKHHTKETLLHMAKNKGHGARTLGRSVALNCTNDNTLEVRIFRGTINVGSFFKAFESIFAIFDFTKKMSFESFRITRKNIGTEAQKVKDLIAENGSFDGFIAPIAEDLIYRNYFFAYVKSLEKRFPNLNVFCANKFGSQFIVESSQANQMRLNKMINNERIYC
tara:strand:- start:675 stop:2009 length:1335 start_codon:yes stop_codon:yes gene_type:complete